MREVKKVKKHKSGDPGPSYTSTWPIRTTNIPAGFNTTQTVSAIIMQMQILLNYFYISVAFSRTVTNFSGVVTSPQPPPDDEYTEHVSQDAVEPGDWYACSVNQCKQ